MKSLKVYLIVVSFLLFVALSFGVYVWYQLQQTHVQIEKIGGKEVVLPKTTEDKRPDQNTDPVIPSEQKGASTTQSSSQTEAVPEVTKPIVVETNTLSDSQQKILKTFGYDEGTLTITPAMILCAEEAVGKDRLKEIMDGSSPSALESIKILPCFKA